MNMFLRIVLYFLSLYYYFQCISLLYPFLSHPLPYRNQSVNVFCQMLAQKFPVLAVRFLAFIAPPMPPGGNVENIARRRDAAAN